MDWTQALTIIGSILIPTLAGFGWIIHRMDQKFEHVDLKFDRIDVKFDHIEKRMDLIETRLKIIETILAMMGTPIKEFKKTKN